MTVVFDPNNAEYLAKKREKLQLDNRASSRAQFRSEERRVGKECRL